MKRMLIFCLLLTGMQAFAQHESLKVVLIRHGEKNDATGNLSCQGLHRAMMIPDVLNKKFARAAYIFTPSLNDHKETGHARMFQTITPYAVQNGVAINTKYGVNKDSAVAKQIKTLKGVVIVCWEHGNIPDIAKALGVQNPGKWGGTDFDSIWIVTYSKDKSGNWVATMSTDKEGLNPPTTCNF